MFTYTPFAAVVFAPLSVLSVLASNIAMTLASVVALVVTVGASLRSLGYRTDWGWAGATLAIAAVGATLEPVHETLAFGQVNLVLMAIVVVDLCLPDTSRFKGIGVGLATGFKLTPAIFIPYLFLTRRWAAGARAVATAAGTVVFAFAVLPAESADFWFDRLLIDSERLGGVAYVANQSVRGALIRWTGSVDGAVLVWWTLAAIGAVTGLWAAARLSRRGPELAGIVVCALTGLLISPVSWSHHWVWIVPALVLGFDLARRHAWAWILVALGVVVFSAELWAPGIIWQVPARNHAELSWTWTQTIVGNVYLVVGVVGLVSGLVLAVRAGTDRSDRRSVDVRMNAP
jgi:alpha-1,2-mannosyltransferase